MTICIVKALPSTMLGLQTGSSFQQPGSDASAAIAQNFLEPSNAPSRKSNNPKRPTQKEELRHILLGSPEAIRQAIHQLHTLNYAETALWSPVMAVGERLILTPEQGEFMSLLKRSL